MESWVIDMEIKWTAGTKPPRWPIIGAVILVYLKIPIHQDYNPDDGAEPTDVTPLLSQSNPLVPITQLAWLLHSILSQDPAGNESVLSTLSTASPASPDLSPLSYESLNHDGFTHLAAHLAILANVIVQRLPNIDHAFFCPPWRQSFALSWHFDRFDPCPAVHLQKSPAARGRVCV